MMESGDNTLFLEKMKALSDVLVEKNQPPEVLKALVVTLAEFLNEDDMAGEPAGDRGLLVDILSNNALWIAKAGVAEQRRQAALESREQALQHVHQTLLKKNMELRERSMIDDLTGLFNRRYFERSLSYDIERFKRYERPIGVILFDIDRFKLINDTYGHAVGDMALQHLAQLAKQMIRSADILARYGGEEFTLLLPETDTNGAHITAERLREFVSASPFNSQAGPVFMSVSCGVTALEGHFDGTLDDVMRTVDKALYEAKDLGRNKVVVA